jgi:Ca-activated chloride channel family protein
LVILISDGEDLGGDAVDAAKEAAKEAVVIHTVGVGTQAGAPIPVEDAKGNMVLVKEPDGALHLSRLNEDILRQIASETGGTCSSIASPSWSIKGIISRAESKPGGRSQSTLVTYYHERFQLPLFLSLALLMAEALVPRGRRMKLREEDS